MIVAVDYYDPPSRLTKVSIRPAMRSERRTEFPNMGGLAALYSDLSDLDLNRLLGAETILTSVLTQRERDKDGPFVLEWGIANKADHRAPIPSIFEGIRRVLYLRRFPHVEHTLTADGAITFLRDDDEVHYIMSR